MDGTVLGDGRLAAALGAGFAGSPAHHALARRFRVLAADAPGGDTEAAGRAFAAGLGDDGPVGLIGFGAAAAAILWAAAALGERVSAIVLVSPEGLLDAGDVPLQRLLTETTAPKAVLIGSRDAAQPREALSLYRRALTRCSPVLVFDAGADIAADRPEAFADVAGDFLDRQARFAFAAESVALSP